MNSTARLPGPARTLRRDLARDADRKQRRGGRAPGVGLDREAGRDQRRRGAAHGGDPGHQRMAVADARVPRCRR